MNVDVYKAFELLKESDHILLLTHRLPDGDALGSLTAVYEVLKGMNKRVTYLLDTLPSNLLKYAPKAPPDDFEIKTVITVDVGGLRLLDDNIRERYANRVLLNIDHHFSNDPFAEYTLCDPKAAAACEVIFDMLTAVNVPISKEIADSLYLGITTDTGCFRYSNATAKTHRAAACLIEAGADSARMNTEIFETKSKQMLAFEAAAMNALRFYENGKIAMMIITREMYDSTGISESDDKAINALPRQVEGVLAGVTVKQKKDGSGYRVSIRTNEPVSASDICVRLGGGGHRLAAGCEPEGDLERVKSVILTAVKEVFRESGVL